MKVITHNASPVLGGGEIWNCRLLAGLAHRGHDVLALCRNEAIAGATRDFGVPARVRVLGGDVMLHHALRFAGELRRERPDALLLTTYKKMWLGAMAARIARVPKVVVRIGRSTDGVRNITYRYPLEHWVDCVVVNETSLVGPFDAAARGKVPVEAITDGVPAADSLAPVDLRAELGLPRDTLLLGSVGRLSIGHKRLDRLIDVLVRLPPHVHAVAIGEGPDRDRIVELATAAGVAERFHAIGFRRDVPALLPCLDLFVVCSDYESLVNSMLEALTAGVAVVSTPVSGAVNALHDGAGIISGWSAAELAATISTLLADRARLARMGDRARVVARERYSFTRMLDQWEELLLRPITHG